MLHVSYSVLIFVLRLTLQGHRRNITPPFLSNYVYATAEDDTSCIVQLVGQLLALGIGGENAPPVYTLKFPRPMNLTECYKMPIVDKRVCNLKASLQTI